MFRIVMLERSLGKNEIGLHLQAHHDTAVVVRKSPPLTEANIYCTLLWQLELDRS